MVEFRLYYDDNGNFLCYTCDDMPGNYLVIDKDSYAEGRPDVRIINGQIIKLNEFSIISKLVPDINGTKCPVEDVCIIADSNYDGKTISWIGIQYEYRCS